MKTEIIISGFGGQGVLSMGKILAYSGLMEDNEFADIVEICQQQGFITVKDMIREFGVTRYHANKVLNDLCEEPAARMYATKEGPITLYRLWKKE